MQPVTDGAPLPAERQALPWMVRIGNFFFRYRDFVFPLLFVALALLTRPAFPMGSRGFDIAVDIVGLGLALAGQSLRGAVIGFAYVKRGGKNKQVYASRLVQEGFFAHSRNPLYVGNLLVLSGLIVIHGSPWFVAIGLPFYLFAYLAITVAEENYLRGKFPAEYVDYCRRVPRFLPRWSGLGKSIEGMRFDWGRLVRKEYGSTFIWIACALGLFVWEDFRNFGFEAARPRLEAVLVLLVPLVAGYATARVLKKTGRLGHG